MKIDRLIGIITILLKKEKVTAPNLAEKFEVSRRTILRDIDDICKAGIPIVTTQGYDGGITIADGYKIDKSILSSKELEAVLTGLKSLESITDSSYVSRIADKFSAPSDSVTADGGSIIIDLVSNHKSDLSQKFQLIKSAIDERKMISFEYFYNKGEENKTVEPYFLIFKWEAWYVFSYAPERQDFRMYKLNRLTNLSCTDVHFEKRKVPEEKIDLDSYFTEDIKVLALFNPSVKYKIIETCGVESFTVREDGKLLFDGRFKNIDYVLSWIQSFGDKVEVLEPQELRDELKKQAENIAEKYK